MKRILTISLLLAACSFSLMSQTTRFVGTQAQFVSALSSSSAGDIISIARDIVVTSEISLDKSVVIQGNGYIVTVPNNGLDDMGKYNTTTSSWRVFSVSGSVDVTINDLTIKGGYYLGSGGAIYNPSASVLRLNNCIISNSRGASGGGLCNSGTVFLTGSSIIRNAATYGGGVLNSGSSARMYIECSTLSENRSTSAGGGGGAAENNGFAVMYVNNSTISNNQSTEIGGGINNLSSATVYLINSSLTGNVAYGSYSGGAVGNNGGYVYAINSLFAHNYKRNGGTVDAPSNFILDDFVAYSQQNHVFVYYSIYHASLPSGTNDVVGNVQYTGTLDGADNTIFSGGNSSQIMDATGVLIGTATVYRPYLYSSDGSVAPTLKTGSFILDASHKGTQTRFSNNNNSNPSIGYYDRTTQTWVDFLGTCSSEQLVTTDQNRTIRATSWPAIGAIEGITDNLYMLKVESAGTSGSVNGCSFYGDNYPSGTEVELTAVPTSGYTFTGWSYVVGGEGVASTANPYTLTIDRNITLKPVFAANPAGYYTVTYIGNENTDGEAPSSVVFTGSHTIEGHGTLVKKGFTFNGWNTNPYGTGTAYAVGLSYSSSADLVLYAQWKNPSFIWSGTEGTDWSNSANWIDVQVPSVDDDVVIMDGGSPIIENGITANTKNITIQAGGKIEIANGGTLNTLENIVLESDGDNTAQILNDGTINRSGKVILRKIFAATNGWKFVGFPYNVSDANIKIAGTGTQASWGDITGTGVDFYVQEYNASRRDATGTAVTVNSPNWKNVSPRTLVMNKGYIMAVPSDITLDFVYESGTTTMFDNFAEKSVEKYTANVLPVHNSWNLLGNPFASGFDLANATQSHAPFYYYDGSTYQTIMSGDSYKINSFGAFFVQAHGAEDVMDYASAGRALKSLRSEDSFEEIGLLLSNAKYTDRTRIRLQEGASDDYEIGKDGVKFLSLRSDVPQLYTQTKKCQYSVNALPLGTTEVPLKVQLMTLGTYTISMEDIGSASSYSQIILIDGTKKTNLLEGKYTFEVAQSTTKDMTIQLVSIAVPTQVISAVDNTIEVSTVDKGIYITGLDGAARIEVYDLSGQLVQLFNNVVNNEILVIGNDGVNVLSIITDTQTAKAKVLIK